MSVTVVSDSAKNTAQERRYRRDGAARVQRPDVVTAADSADLEDGGALDPIAGQVGQRPVGGVERVRGRGHPDADAGGDGQEVLAVVPGVGRDAADLALLEQVALVVERRDVVRWMPAIASVPPRSSASSAAGTSSPGRGEEDRRVQRLGRRVERVADPRGAELAARAGGRRPTGS